MGAQCDKRPTATPPTLHVTSTLDVTNGSISSGMNQGSGSGKPEELPMPPKVESPSLPSRHAEDRLGCTCEPGCCTCKKTPSLSTVWRPGCSPRAGTDANAVASASNGPP